MNTDAGNRLEGGLKDCQQRNSDKHIGSAEDGMTCGLDCTRQRTVMKRRPDPKSSATLVREALGQFTVVFDTDGSKHLDTTHGVRNRL